MSRGLRVRNNEYSLNLYNIEPPITNINNNKKITDDKFFIPDYNDFLNFCNYNYRVNQLKNICKHYKLKVSGTKNELYFKIYNYLRLSSNIIKIQKIIRGNFQRKCINYQGPALFKRNICVNSTDFYTLQDIKDISFEQFFSFTDSDNFIYGFDIISIYTLLNCKKKSGRFNPYNRSDIPGKIKKQLVNYLVLCKKLKKNIKTCDDENEIIDPKKNIEFKALDLFQYMDQLGNYTHSRWFLSLNREQLILYVRELYDIWNYRANLTQQIKFNICPPNGDPFRCGHNLMHLYNKSLIEIQEITLTIISKFIRSASTDDNKSLGAFYVLAALTLVNTEAAETLPWLFQSVQH